jgi:hypothetical protein
MPHGSQFCYQICRSRSLIIQVKCETFASTERSLAVLAHMKGDAMKKTLMALAAVATLAASAMAPAPAQAQRFLGAAVAGGIVGGAIVGGAIAASPYYYGPGYYAPPAYYGPGYGYYGGPPPAYAAAPGPVPGGPPCVWQRQRFWDGYAWQVRKVRVCG